MLDLPQSGKEDSNQTHAGQLNDLHREIQRVILQVEDVQNNLLSGYPREALSQLGRYFEAINNDFTNYALVSNNSFYRVIHRSASRLKAVKNVAREAKAIAQLFEKYFKNPKSYSAVDSRLQINRLRGELTNLLTYLGEDIKSDVNTAANFSGPITSAQFIEKDEQTLSNLDQSGMISPPNITPNASIEEESKTPDQQTSVSIDSSALSDLYSKEDLLGHLDYVNALANFIESPKTKKPITIGINAVWGAGKTTLMRLLEKRLGVSEHAASKSESIRTVWFNAWQYDQQEALWAALVLEILTQVRKQFTWKQRAKLFFALNYKRFKWGRLGWDMVKFILIVSVLIGAGYLGFSLLAKYLGKTWVDAFEWLKDWVKVFATIGLASLAYTIFKDLSGFIVSPFSLGISQYMKEPDYKNKIGFVNQFQEDFKYAIESVTQKGKWPLVVFIDDLDRCSALKTAEVIEAINLLIDSEHCVFVIGMDSIMLSRSIQAKYKDIESYFDDMEHPSRIGLGRHFLEKIIQIDFHIPQPDKLHITNFINAQLGKSLTQEVVSVAQQAAESLIQAEQRAGKTEDEAKKVVQDAHPDLSPVVVDAAAESVQERAFEELPEVLQIINELAPYLNYNPRRIKRFINMYRLQSLIAYQRNILETVVSLDNLACWIVINMRWPEFINYAVKDTRIISQMRLDVLDLEKVKDKVAAIEKIRKSGKYPFDLLPLLIDVEFGELLNKITGKAGDASNYFHLSQLSLTA